MIPNYEIYGLNQIKGIGPSRIQKICNLCSNLDSITELDQSKFLNISGITKSILDLMRSTDFDLSKQELEEHKSEGIDFITIYNQSYPQLLKSIYNPPIGIFINRKFEFNKTIAIVGSRNVSQYGKKITKLLAKELVHNGFTIVSGFARGIDSIAHKTALEYGGNTIGVLANGLDICYPPENFKLYKEMWDKGIFISEHSKAQKPEAMYFPKRNRIISGLSLGTIVVEAGEKSGAIITAYNALEQNRDVFAVPGRIDSKLSIGCNKLIKEGAKPVLSIQDILESYEMNNSNSPTPQLELIPNLNNNEKLILKQLSHDSIHIDKLVKNVGLSGQLILSVLLELELKGLIVQLPGKNFAIN